MSKGLGRGLSSLFAVYDKKEETPQKPATEEKKPDILNNADNLLEKYQKKSTVDNSENANFLKEKATVEQKLKVADEEMHSSGARQIAINRIIPNPEQPRKNFNQEALKELAQSIREHGIIQPIIVVQKGENYQIIAGERRFRAAKIANLKTIPVIIKNYSDREIKEIALIENLQREDLNPIETAVAIKQLIDSYGFTQDEVALKIGKSRPVVANSLRLLSLEPEVLTLVEKGKLLPGIARAIINLPREQQISLAKKACDDKMTAREVEKTVQEMLRPEAVPTKKTTQLSMELMSMKDDLQQVFGTKVTILGNDKKGRIYLDYYNQDDLDRIYGLINKLK